MAEFINNNLIQFAIIIVVILLAGIGLVVYGYRKFNTNQDSVSQRLQFVADNRDRSQSTNFIYRIFPREISGSFFSRTIKPFFQKIIDYFGKFTPANSVAEMDRNLSLAGNPYGMHAQDFYGVRVILLLFAIGVAFFLNYQSKTFDLLLILLGGSIILAALLLPKYWLNSKVRERKDEFRRNLPDALDMLSVCATAGLGFDQGLKKISELWPTQLSQEFKHVLQEMDMGVSRADALRNMSKRIDVDEISSFIAIIIQAESIGMSFSDVLHSQAEQMRILRHFRAKEIANAMPAKMIIPLVLFIFPALIAVIIGPIVPTILDIFS
jgi:tight adherence protein C